MVHSGSDLKFRIATDLEGFSLGRDPFAITVFDHYGRVRWQLTKNECFYDAEGQWYFLLDRVPRGVYFAQFTAFTPDMDFNDTYRRTLDRQLLIVVDYHAPLSRKHCSHDTHFVTYTLTSATNMDTGTYLEGSDGSIVFTSDDQRIEITPTAHRRVQLDELTGEEFKQMIEGRSDDAKINTVPEVLDVLQGMDEDTQLTTMTETDVDDMMQRVLTDTP